VQQLQDAIWYFMGVGPNTGNQFILAADAHFGSDASALIAGNGGYNIEVMNVWALGQEFTQSGKRQDMLVLRVPDGGLTVILLGIGIGVLAVIARRLGR
jgi:hypothetical protein